MSDKKKADSSPDFNDEYIKYGIDDFRLRLRERFNGAGAAGAAEKEEALAQALPSEVEHWEPGAMPDEEAPPSSEGFAQSAGWELMMLRGRDGFKGCAYNATLIFENDERWKGVFAENLFTGAIDIMREPPISAVKVGELEDPSVAMIHCWIEENYEVIVQDSAMRKALIKVAAHNRYHPVQDYLNNLPEWDGKPRCDTWLARALGAKNEPEKYLKAVGSMFLIGAIRRIMNIPKATKVDNMLVFEGLQGDGKSTLIEVLFTPWHGDTPLPLGDKDSYIMIRGSWGYEMAEMDSFNKAAASTAKTFLSSKEDNYRPPFGTKNIKYPRQTVLIGSVNHIEYLTDSTGNRRYWPVYAHKIDVEWLRENRAQLWAEALSRYKKGERHWIEKKENPELNDMVINEQALREHPDAWEAKICAWIWSDGCNKSKYTIAEILEDVIKIDIRAVSKQHEMKISNALQRLEFTKERMDVAKPGERRRRPWFYMPPADAIKAATIRPENSMPEAKF